MPDDPLADRNQLENRRGFRPEQTILLTQFRPDDKDADQAVANVAMQFYLLDFGR